MSHFGQMRSKVVLGVIIQWIGFFVSWHMGCVAIFDALVFPSPACAADVDSAKKDQAKAQSDFYDALKKSKYPSTDEVKSLREKILIPKQDALNQAREAEYQQKNPAPPVPAGLSKPYDRQKVHDSHMARFQAAIDKALDSDSKDKDKNKDKDKAKDSGDQKSSGSEGGKYAPSDSAQDSAPAAPETILDGSNLPREIEFNTKTKK